MILLLKRVTWCFVCLQTRICMFIISYISHTKTRFVNKPGHPIYYLLHQNHLLHSAHTSYFIIHTYKPGDCFCKIIFLGGKPPNPFRIQKTEKQNFRIRTEKNSKTQTKTYVEVTYAGIVEVAKSRTAVVRIAVPRTAPQHTRRATS